MKTVHLAGLAAVAALLACASPALAQAVAEEGARVTFPIGEWVDNGVGLVFGAVAIAATAAMRSLPAHLQWALSFVQANENLGKALAFARAELKKKYGTISWTVDVRSEAIALALRYGRDHFPKMIEKRFGGLDATREKLAARLEEWIERAVEKIS